MVQGRLDYCNSVLHLSSSANLHKLQRIQNSLARIVIGKHRHEHHTNSCNVALAASQILLLCPFQTGSHHFQRFHHTHNLAELLSVNVPRRDLRSGNYQRLHVYLQGAA